MSLAAWAAVPVRSVTKPILIGGRWPHVVPSGLTQRRQISRAPSSIGNLVVLFMGPSAGGTQIVCYTSSEMAVEFKDYYRILGVDRKADEKTIKSAFRRLARKHHPDVAKGKDATDRFKEINEAYEVLSDPEKRRRYDTLGPDWQRYAQQAPGQPGGGFRVEYQGGDVGDFSDFFRTIFGDLGGRQGSRGGRGERGGVNLEDLLGGGGGFGGRQPRGRGDDVQAGVEITLEEAFAGARKTFSLEMDEPCPTCHGAGNVGGKPCMTCGGSGWQRARRQLDVKIPAGVKTGQRVRVAG